MTAIGDEIERWHDYVTEMLEVEGGHDVIQREITKAKRRRCLYLERNVML